MPAIAVGVSDSTTGAGSDYMDMGVDGSGNGYFNLEDGDKGVKGVIGSSSLRS